MAWKSLTDDKLLWRWHMKEPFHSDSLTIMARRVLGTWESTGMDWTPESVSDYLRVKEQYADALLGALDRSTHPVILKAIKVGLPVEAAVYIDPEWRIKCKYCHARLISVPCNWCVMQQNRHEVRNGYWKERFPLRLREPVPTLLKPGSPGKFKLMCERAARGESVFSDLDAKADLR